MKTIFLTLTLLAFGLTGFSQTTWTGTTDSDWATATNWDSGQVPTSTDNVVIPTAPTGGNMPLVTVQDAVCNDLTSQTLKSPIF